MLMHSREILSASPQDDCLTPLAAASPGTAVLILHSLPDEVLPCHGLGPGMMRVHVRHVAVVVWRADHAAYDGRDTRNHLSNRLRLGHAPSSVTRGHLMG